MTPAEVPHPKVRVGFIVDIVPATGCEVVPGQGDSGRNRLPDDTSRFGVCRLSDCGHGSEPNTSGDGGEGSLLHCVCHEVVILIRESPKAGLNGSWCDGAEGVWLSGDEGRFRFTGSDHEHCRSGELEAIPFGRLSRRDRLGEPGLKLPHGGPIPLLRRPSNQHSAYTRISSSPIRSRGRLD